MIRPYVLWDFDGTLADTGKDVWASLEYAARRSGGSLEKDYRAQDAHLADSMSEIMRHVTPYPGSDHLTDFDDDVRVHYRTLNQFTETRLYQGIRPLLEKLHTAGVRNIIVTNKPQGALLRILDNKGWRSLFDGWTCPDSDPDQAMDKNGMIARTLAANGITAAQCVYVGDTFSDVAAARANGVIPIAVTYGDGDTLTLLEQEPNYVASNVAELQDIITHTVIGARSTI